MPPRRHPATPPLPRKLRHVHEGRLTIDEENGAVLWVLEETHTRAGFGIGTGGLVDKRLKDRKVRVIIEEV